MVHLKKAVFDINISSLFSDKVVIEEITVDGLDLYYEQKFRTNNVSDLQANVEKNLGIKDKKSEPVKQEKPAEKVEKTDKEPAEAKKLQVDKILLRDITAHVVISGADIPVMMVPINMEKLGTGPEGITAGGVFAAILNKLSMGAADAVVEAAKKGTAAAGDALQNLGDSTGKALQNLGDSTGKALDNAGKELQKGAESLKNLFK